MIIIGLWALFWVAPRYELINAPDSLIPIAGIFNIGLGFIWLWKTMVWLMNFLRDLFRKNNQHGKEFTLPQQSVVGNPGDHLQVGMHFDDIVMLLGEATGMNPGTDQKLKGSQVTPEMIAGTLYCMWERPEGRYLLVVEHGRLARIYERPKAAQTSETAPTDRDELRHQFETLDLTNVSLEDLVTRLREGIAWQNANMSQRYNLKEDFAIREIGIIKVGEELNRRGGRELMLQAFVAVGSPRSIEMIWDGIGDWYG